MKKQSNLNCPKIKVNKKEENLKRVILVLRNEAYSWLADDGSLTPSAQESLYACNEAEKFLMMGNKERAIEWIKNSFHVNFLEVNQHLLCAVWDWAEEK